MTKTQLEVITSAQRRRRRSKAEKERIVAAALEPGAVASEVARTAGIYPSQLSDGGSSSGLLRRARRCSRWYAKATAPNRRL
jgi:transposase-like protein